MVKHNSLLPIELKGHLFRGWPAANIALSDKPGLKSQAALFDANTGTKWTSIDDAIHAQCLYGCLCALMYASINTLGIHYLLFLGLLIIN